LLGSDLKNTNNTPTAIGLGGTALAGLHYQANADMILGVNVGWRYFTDAKFSVTTSDTSSSTSDVAYPGMNSNGPVLQAFLNYAF